MSRCHGGCEDILNTTVSVIVFVVVVSLSLSLSGALGRSETQLQTHIQMEISSHAVQCTDTPLYELPCFHVQAVADEV